MHGVSDSGPFDDDLPEDFNLGDLFGGSGDPAEMMTNMMRMFSGLAGGGGGLDSAMQIAVSIASGGSTEANVDPVDRMALEQLGRVAELHVGQATGLRTSSGSPLTIAPVNKGEWVRRSMQAYKPLLEQLASSMATPAVDGELADDPQMAAFEQLFSSMRPMMVNLTTGSMIGHIGSRALGTYDLPIPRPGSNELLVVVPSLDAFGEEWSLERDELRLWIALSEVAHHTVLSIPHVAQHMTLLLGKYANAFRNDPTAITDSLEHFEPSGDFADIQARIQEMFGDPSAMLGSMRSVEQEAILPDIAAATGAIVGYVDHIMDSIGSTLITSYGQMTEALRRRRVTASSSDRFVERLLGLELDQDLYDRGRAFIDGIVEREGEEGLGKLWEKVEHLPTPNELEAPGLWLARIDL
jgi:putative hydrolase